MMPRRIQSRKRSAVPFSLPMLMMLMLSLSSSTYFPSLSVHAVASDSDLKSQTESLYKTSNGNDKSKSKSNSNNSKLNYLRPQQVHEMAQATQDQWMSLTEGIEFLPSQKMVAGGGRGMSDAQIRKWAASQLEKNREQQDAMRRMAASSPLPHAQQQQQQRQQEQNSRNLGSSSGGSSSSIYNLSPFVEGETEYDEYQQAWRLLGFMIDCDDDISDWMTDDWYQQNGGGNSGSGDEGTGEGCHRYVLWAAYIDLDYQGGGIGEYQYWDKWKSKWNDVACTVAAEGQDASRCAKMDCHLEDTHWSLLGMFKHRSMDDWMEQLFKHEGICVWTDDEYDFMSDAREAWPQGCIATDTVTDSGDTIYYSTKPIAGAKLTIGLYTDTRCVEEYVSQGSNDPITIENVVGNILADAGSGDNGGDQDDDRYSSYETTLAMWDDALETFRTCQPCVAYDVNNYGYNFDDDAMKGSSYGTYTYGYDDDYRYNYYYGNGNAQGSDFDCYDDADYTNVNQCMKFMAKTEMNTASFRDILLADKQGTLASNPLGNYMNSKNQSWMQRRRNSTSSFGMWFWFTCSVLLLGYGYISFRKIQKQTNYKLPRVQLNAKQPLVFA